MIPKIIHYCWFGRSDIPNSLKKCIQTWKQFMPEYQIIRWDETNFDINSITWTKQAYEEKKYAFVSDYVRLKVLYKYGGIYLDTDVKLIMSLEKFAKYKAFTGFESRDKLTSAVIGAEPGFELIKEFILYYKERQFILPDGSTNKEANVVMLTEVCKKYGLKLDNSEQEILGMHIFPRTYFCPLDFYMNKSFTDKTHAIHFFKASWLDEDTKKHINLERGAVYKLKSKLLIILSGVYHKLIGEKK